MRWFRRRLRPYLLSRSHRASSETAWPAAEQAAVLRDLHGSPSWCVDNFQLTDSLLHIEGWALPLASGGPTVITLNGIALETGFVGNHHDLVVLRRRG